MRILYCSWGELIKDSCIDAMRSEGFTVEILDFTVKKYDFDDEFQTVLKNAIRSGNYKGDADEYIFSFNYFPDISRVANEECITYISWVYDSPHLTLQSNTLNNRLNKVFLFDYALYEKYKLQGFTTVNYLPLPARIFKYPHKEFKHEISFVGNLYDGGQDQYGQINTFPDYLSGYMEAVIQAQERVYGYDIVEKMITDEVYEGVKKFVNAELSENYRKCGKDIFEDMLRKRVTKNERIKVLSALGEKHRVDLFSETVNRSLPVNYMGVVDYSTKMPDVFSESKINLNISLKSIRTGIPLRVMDILGAGGFCLTNYQAEIAEYFTNGEDLVWYENANEVADIADYYLRHDSEREKIAMNGHRKVEELFSYKNMLKKMFEVFDGGSKCQR
ncbi:MAG: glycosyltransferase [Lachnospiraceae bacterium]|nr:glycosyltransferase [Lachnospiraceae bacterium]